MTDEEFTEVYKKYSDEIYILCFNFLKNKADTEDAVSDTFIKFYNNNDLFNSDEHRKAWLIVTASNVCKSQLRKWWHKSHDDIDEMELPDERNEDFRNRELYMALMNLPVKYKTVIYMYYYEGYKATEIAKILKSNESTVRSLLKRGREHLRSELGMTGAAAASESQFENFKDGIGGESITESKKENIKTEFESENIKKKEGKKGE